MVKKLLGVSLIIFFSLVASAQVEDSTNNNEEVKEQFLDHYFSLQINELLRQILNLSNTSGTTHPYFLNYAINHHKTGLGINTGFGATYFTTHDGDETNEISTEMEDINFRIGPEKKFYFGKRLIAGIGIDYIWSESKFITTEKFNIDQVQYTEKIVEENYKSEGLGPRLSLSFKITRWMLIGTEASYYYSLEKKKETTTQTESFISRETQTVFEEEFEDRIFDIFLRGDTDFQRHQQGAEYPFSLN